MTIPIRNRQGSIFWRPFCISTIKHFSTLWMNLWIMKDLSEFGENPFLGRKFRASLTSLVNSPFKKNWRKGPKKLLNSAPMFADSLSINKSPWSETRRYLNHMSSKFARTDSRGCLPTRYYYFYAVGLKRVAMAILRRWVDWSFGVDINLRLEFACILGKEWDSSAPSKCLM
jgi:hypothetical protein